MDSEKPHLQHNEIAEEASSPQHQQIGAKVLTVTEKTKVTLPDKAWYDYRYHSGEDYSDDDGDDLAFYNFAAETISPMLTALDPKNRARQNQLFTALAQENDNDEIAFIHEIMHGDIDYYEDGNYDDDGQYVVYYDFIGFLTENQNCWRSAEYRQFLDWYHSKLTSKAVEFAEKAEQYKQEFQAQVRLRVDEGVLPTEYLVGLNSLISTGTEYQLTDAVDSHADFFDGSGCFAATASTIHRDSRSSSFQDSAPLATYNLASDYNYTHIAERLAHEFFHMIGGNIHFLTGDNTSDADTIFEEGATEVAREVLETGKLNITPNGPYSTDKQVLNYLCQGSDGEITVMDILRAHAGRSKDQHEQQQLINKIQTAFPWWQGEQGVADLLVERRIWFGQQDKSGTI